MSDRFVDGYRDLVLECLQNQRLLWPQIREKLDACSTRKEMLHVLERNLFTPVSEWDILVLGRGGVLWRRYTESTVGLWRNTLLLLITPLRTLMSSSLVPVQPAVGAWMTGLANLLFRGKMLDAFVASRNDVQNDVFTADSEIWRQWFQLRGRYYLFAMFFWKPMSALASKVPFMRTS